MNASLQINRRRSRLRIQYASRGASVPNLGKRAVLALSAAGALLSLVGCDRVKTPELTKIPLQSCSGLPCVDATFGGAKLRLLVSLADGKSYLTPLGAVKADAKRTSKELGKVRRFKLATIELSDVFAIDETINQALPKAAESLSPPVDGSLSYNAFNERLLVLNIPEHSIELSLAPLTGPACPSPCSQLQDSKVGDRGPSTLTTDGFNLGNVPLHAGVDTLFQGSVVILGQLQGLRNQGAGTAEGLYRQTKLSFVETAPVYFGSKGVATAAAITRVDPSAFGVAGREYDSAVGLSILSKGAYAFDLRSMKMWRYQ